MKIGINPQGVQALQQRLQSKFEAIPKASAKAITNMAWEVKKSVVSEMQARLDRPTPYTTSKAIQVVAATEASLTARVGLGIYIDAPGKGTPYEKALGHLFTGGSREFKRMEGAFRRLGALPAGMMMVPGAACPLDAYGNPKRGFIVQLISYFNGFGEQGYKANMTDRRRKNLAKAGRTENGYKTINGVQYFISYGRRGKPGGDRYVHGRHDQHLAAGIWERRGTHGVRVRPVFLFVRAGNWRRYINLKQIADQTISRAAPSIFGRALRGVGQVGGGE